MTARLRSPRVVDLPLSGTRAVVHRVPSIAECWLRLRRRFGRSLYVHKFPESRRWEIGRVTADDTYEPYGRGTSLAVACLDDAWGCADTVWFRRFAEPILSFEERFEHVVTDILATYPTPASIEERLAAIKQHRLGLLEGEWAHRLVLACWLHAAPTLLRRFLRSYSRGTAWERHQPVDAVDQCIEAALVYFHLEDPA